MTMPQNPPDGAPDGRIAKIGFQDLTRQLAAAGLPLPVPLTRAVQGDVRPVAVGSREAWAAWAVERGYDAGQVETLLTALAKLTHSGAYRGALATDLSARHDVDGQVVEPVGPFDRHSAALIEHAKALHDATKAAKEPRGAYAPRGAVRPTRPSPPAETAPPVASPAPQAQPHQASAGREPRQKREMIRLGGLSAAEIERRKAAFSAAGR